MPVYQIQGKNGKTYQINGPVGATREQIIAAVLAQAPEAGQVKSPVEDVLEEIPLVGGLLTGTADVGLGAIQGLAGVTGAATEAFGADTRVSNFFESISDGARKLMSAQERGDLEYGQRLLKEAEDKGVLEQVKAAAKAFSRSPLTMTAQALGSAAPFVAAGVATKGAALPTMLGAVAGAGTVKGGIYDAVEEEARASGMAAEQASALAREAQSYLGDNVDQIALGTVLGGVASRFGLEPGLAKLFGQQVAKRAIVRGAVAEAVPEAVQAGQERMAQNIALSRAGFETPLGRGVAGQAALEGMMGAVPGGIVGAMQRGPREERETEADTFITAEAEALPAGATDEAKAAATQRFVQFGFNEETAATIVNNIAASKAAAERQAERDRQQREEAVAARTAGVEPSPEPDITAPGMVREEQEFAAPPEDPEVVAERLRAYEAEMGEAPGAFRTTYDINGEQRVEEGFTPTVVPTPTPAPTPTVEPDVDSMALYPTGGDLTPERAEAIFYDDAARDEYVNRGGDLAELRAIAEGEDVGYTPKYSRGRRPVDTATPDMFAGAPLQEAPGEALKREEYNALRFASEEEKAARQAQIAEEMEAGMGRVAAMQQRAKEAEAAKISELQQAIYTAHPSNRAYTVDYREGSRNPYRVLGPNGEVFVTEDNLDDFEESVGDLLPYSVESQESLAAGEVEKPGPEELSEPTVATRMIQDFVAEVDTARKSGQIDDSQRAELLRRLERPDAYKVVNGKEKPNDAIARNEVAARKAMERFNNAPAADKAAAEEALVTANQTLTNSVKNALLNPARAALKTMAETRAASKREAKARVAPAQLQQRLGEGALERPTQVAGELKDAPEKLVIAELKADLSEKTLNKAKRVLEKAQQRKKRDMLTERKLQDAIATAQKRLDVAEAQIGREVGRSERLAAAKEEKGRLERGVREERTKEREAKIDLAQQQVQKYRKAPAKGGMSADAVQKVVDTITKQWKSTNPVEVVQSVSDIPDAKVRRTIKRDKATDAEGLVAPDGTVYLIADNLAGEARAKAVLFHEGLGHLGLEKLFRDKLDAALTTLYNSNAKLKADTDAWRKSNPGAYKRDSNPLARAVEEVLAERSEAGRIQPNLLSRIAAVVRNFARQLGIKLSFSDADVEAVLAAAHERAVLGPQESTLVKGMRYVGAPAQPAQAESQLPPKTQKRVEEAEAVRSVGAERVQNTFSTYGIDDGITEVTGATPTLRDAVLEVKGGMGPAARKAALFTMPTSGILNWLETKAPGVYKAAAVLDDVVRVMRGMKNSLIDSGDKLARDMDDFVREYGTTQLAAVRFMNRINEVDSYEYDTVAEHLQKNKVIVALEKDLLRNSNHTTETRKLIDEIKDVVLKKQDAIKTGAGKPVLSSELRTRLNALRRNAKDASAVDLKTSQLAEMTRRIRDVMQARQELDKQKGGAELYKRERDYHKTMFDARLALLDERIERGLGKEQAVRMKDMRANLMRELQSPEQREKSGDIFWDLDADLFDKDYFPLMREGQYWLRVAEDKKSGREEEFYTFESARKMNQAKLRVARRLGVDPDDAKIIKTGHDISELQNTLRTEDELMQRVFDIVGKARAEYATSGDLDMKQLTDAVYQTWLMTTPERSARRRFMHAKEIAGFSPDVLLHFKQQVTTNANELAKLAYAGRVRAAVSGIKDTIKDSERPGSEQAELGDFARELEKRAEQELNPEQHNPIVNMLNRASYFYYLTGAVTALTNFANIPIRVMPRFWREFGFAEGNKMWLKYMKMWNSLGRVKLERTNASFGEYLDAVMPDVNGSNFVKNSADLQWAKSKAMERDLLVATTETLVQNERATPGSTKLGLTRATQDVVANTGKVMGFLFRGTENIARQATFYMAFELAMKDYAKKNPKASLEDKRDHAFKQAVRITNDTVGDFSDWERSRITKSEYTRAVFLFKMHPILQTKYMVGALNDIWKGTGTGGRAGALKEFSGVLMMAGALGGVTAMPFYTALAHALAQGFDEEDDEDVRKLMGIDVRTAYDADIMFRSWLAEKLGDPKGDGPDLAEMLTYGPAGAMTDTEISSRVSLDLKNLWFRDPIAGDTLEQSMIAGFIANIAPLGMASSLLRGLEDFEEGNTRFALAKILPAFFRAPVTAAYTEAEGVVNRKGNTIIPETDITAVDTLRSVTGARSLRLARLQDAAITRAKNEDRIEKERTKILGRLEKQVREGGISSADDFREFWSEEIVPFNRTYPSEAFIITPEAVEDSLKRRAERAARTVYGMELNKKDVAQTAKSMTPFVP